MHPAQLRILNLITVAFIIITVARHDHRRSREAMSRERNGRAVQFTVVLQVKSLFLSPVQYLPLFAGTGRSHSLSEYLMPPPQVLLQAPTGPHSPHPPCTAAGRVPMSTHFLWTHHWIRAHAYSILYITFVPRVRMQYVSWATRRPAFRANTNFQRGESREVSSDTSIYFPGTIKSTSAALASAPKATKSTSARRDAREEGAPFNKSPARRKCPFIRAFPTALRDARIAPRKRHQTQSPFARFDVRR